MTEGQYPVETAWRPTRSDALQPSDQELAQRAQRGDETAFAELVDRYGDELFRLARLLLGNSADAEDVVQDALIGAMRNIGRFEGRSSLKTWLVRILTNHISKFRRSQRVRRALSLNEPTQAGASPDGRLHVGSAVTRTEQRLDIAALLQTLSPDHRQVIVLREFEQLSYEEIAETLGVPRGTVESRLHRARQELRQRLTDYQS